MSYILDALTKAAQQRDRQAPVVQRLLSPAPRPRAPWSPASGRLLAALAVNAVLLAGVLAWWMWPTTPATQPAATTQSEPVAVPAPIAESPRPLKLEPLPSVEPRAEKPTTVTSERSVSTSETSSSAVPPTASPAPTPSSRAAAPASSARASAPTPSPRAAAPAPAQSTLPRSGTPGIQPSAPPAPPVTATPLEAGSLKLEALIYADVPAERMVFINGRRYREGDSIDGRLRVEEIREDGVELSDQGRRFSLRVTSR
jgi:general secretion pathway protein B